MIFQIYLERLEGCQRLLIDCWYKLIKPPHKRIDADKLGEKCEKLTNYYLIYFNEKIKFMIDFCWFYLLGFKFNKIEYYPVKLRISS